MRNRNEHFRGGAGLKTSDQGGCKIGRGVFFKIGVEFKLDFSVITLNQLTPNLIRLDSHLINIFVPFTISVFL